MKQIGLDQIAIKYLDSVQDKKAYAAFFMDDLLHHTYRSKTNLASFYYGYVQSGIENKREFHRVRRLYEQSLEKKDTVIANYMLGRLHYEKREHKKSYKYFSHAFQLKRKPEILFNMGAALYEMEDYRRALTIFKKLSSMESISCRDEALAATVIILSSMQEYEEAKKTFRVLSERADWHISRLMEYAVYCREDGYIIENCIAFAKSGEMTPKEFKSIFAFVKNSEQMDEFIECSDISTYVQEERKHRIELCYLAEFFY